MNTSNLSLIFELNLSEIRKLNKMYFKNFYKERIAILSFMMLLFMMFFDSFSLTDDNEFIKWAIKNVLLVLVFFLFQYSIVNTICKIIFQLTKKLLKFDRFVNKYKFNFTDSSIYVHSPLGEVAHKWSKIEKAILTKDFFFLYVKDRNGYIISISNKCNDRNMNELITFVEKNVTPVTKV
ncbi:YcxB family protein [Flavobacterium pectinovorum]|uniref:YcxB family protein n=1 Tax=Flavobacterium pectinovorum TaxID=29533 RepID=A0A502EM22_9FLAO|nr:YcxB family protein [Flavobacterium pectinovorum]TPG38517.1 YcxB family protein [Flavobacterium pectinovorum]